jgi:hypothetical protein
MIAYNPPILFDACDQNNLQTTIIVMPRTSEREGMRNLTKHSRERQGQNKKKKKGKSPEERRVNFVVRANKDKKRG